MHFLRFGIQIDFALPTEVSLPMIDTKIPKTKCYRQVAQLEYVES